MYIVHTIAIYFFIYNLTISVNLEVFQIQIIFYAAPITVELDTLFENIKFSREMSLLFEITTSKKS
ncbi:hypothetical protein BpHYR1_036798 [Brachionus plicatilis]|uniref:Uncharacterized protein n=1 Tax=Brachionus plicatilis TaxID=10195 RepID=A0A3M7RYU3_BRAPC|nr:hypothetical protein BpHYR1_036798 [Brachionus plicatilis]